MKKALIFLLAVLPSGLIVLLALVAFEFFEPLNTVSFLSPPKPFYIKGAVPEVQTKDIMGQKEVVDGESRVLFFRGISFPIKKGQEVDLEVLKLAKDAGMNAINLMVSWKDLEPLPLKIDLDFVLRLREIVRKAGEVGLRVVISTDMFLENQDILDAVPSFAIRPKRFGLSPDFLWKIRFLQDFLANEFTPDDLTLQDHLISVFVKLAETLQRERNLLGYSPFLSFDLPSSFLEKTLFQNPETCSNALLDFYERFATALRAKDWNAIMFFAIPETALNAQFGRLENAVFLVSPSLLCLEKGDCFVPLKPFGLFVSRRTQQKVPAETLLDALENIRPSVLFFDLPDDKHCSVFRFSRPYPQSVSGAMPRFSVKDNTFSLRFLESGNLFESKVFIPDHWFEKDEKSDAPPFVVDVSDGVTKVEGNIVIYKHRTTSSEHTLTIKRWGNRPLPDPVRDCDSF